MKDQLISIEHLFVTLNGSHQPLLEDVNLTIKMGEMVGLIGESGSGKSLTSRAVTGLLPKEMRVSGRISYGGNNLLELSDKERYKQLGIKIGYIFQDYRGSFTPFIRIGKQMTETIRTHIKLTKKQSEQLAREVLNEVGLEDKTIYHRFPFQLSGGQIQRAAVAMTLALKPELIICDEMTTALDVITGEKVLNYLAKVQKETGCAVLIITHDLAQAYKHTNRIYVMQQGRIVEEGLSEEVRCHHKHPYTKKLCSCLLALPGEDLITTASQVMVK
ncbi:peptide/nickel transport system ATP-binding protein [Natronobacillus azotifigens]|uniref:Nickel import system ATP-binding protein NikD n=1 Tax=Natronobacillus azotifigens TaxID=472978 RepID=A0A9J6RBL9_9BACI|nr:ABC transporter ATP-binding protein [Natronobacillus azotifigens]MCZ0703080.1 ABC transporter ATP-binding protein [Natronobacillus azotifigens]